MSIIFTLLSYVIIGFICAAVGEYYDMPSWATLMWATLVCILSAVSKGEE